MDSSPDDHFTISGTAATTVSGPSHKRDIGHDIPAEPLYEGIEQDGNEDVASIFTNCQDFNLSPDTQESLIYTFSSILCQNLKDVPYAREESVDSVIKALPTYLKDFSIQLKKDASLEHEKAAIVFVRGLKGHVVTTVSRGFD